MHIYIYIYTYIHIYIYVHIHTSLSLSLSLYVYRVDWILSLTARAEVIFTVFINMFVYLCLYDVYL